MARQSSKKGSSRVPRRKDVAPGQRGLLGTVSGTWKDGTTSWTLEAIVTSARGEIYNSRANWR